jgi:hypothetical protein
MVVLAVARNFGHAGVLVIFERFLYSVGYAGTAKIRKATFVLFVCFGLP